MHSWFSSCPSALDAHYCLGTTVKELTQSRLRASALWHWSCHVNIFLGDRHLPPPSGLTDTSPRRSKSVWHSNCPAEFFPYLGMQPAIPISIPTLWPGGRTTHPLRSCEGSWHGPLHSAHLKSHHWEPGGQWRLCLQPLGNGCMQVMPPVKLKVPKEHHRLLPERELFGNCVCEGPT